jgi:hypothetical protein
VPLHTHRGVPQLRPSTAEQTFLLLPEARPTRSIVQFWIAEPANCQKYTESVFYLFLHFLCSECFSRCCKGVPTPHPSPLCQQEHTQCRSVRQVPCREGELEQRGYYSLCDCETALRAAACTAVGALFKEKRGTELGTKWNMCLEWHWKYVFRMTLEICV